MPILLGLSECGSLLSENRELLIFHGNIGFMNTPVLLKFFDWESIYMPVE